MPVPVRRAGALSGEGAAAVQAGHVTMMTGGKMSPCVLWEACLGSMP